MKKGTLTSAMVLAFVCTFSVTNSAFAARTNDVFTSEALCKAGLALAIDKQPRGINAKGGKHSQVLLSLKNGQNDWDYRCDVNRGSKTLNIVARDITRNDAYLKQAIRYDVNNGGRSVEVKMKRRKGSVKSAQYQALQLNNS
ncbi:hypothetical protein [Vibrio methylphosphonaticus]|uniref:hypothetical protein n=1 Tax=Vibrio methylphosphonaticus TaxID=2946866 RepID=UPI002029C6C8|nr:hypothetical protein [Vibrio methylphosphonaticus]MCL9777204.1 hypothetical protein [Vibrio methylphosphonaticus]